MELSFETKALRAACLERQLAEEQYGPTVAAALRSRLADLDAAVVASDLPRSEAIVFTAAEIHIALSLDQVLGPVYKRCIDTLAPHRGHQLERMTPLPVPVRCREGNHFWRRW